MFMRYLKEVTSFWCITQEAWYMGSG